MPELPGAKAANTWEWDPQELGGAERGAVHSSGGAKITNEDAPCTKSTNQNFTCQSLNPRNLPQEAQETSQQGSGSTTAEELLPSPCPCAHPSGFAPLNQHQLIFLKTENESGLSASSTDSPGNTLLPAGAKAELSWAYPSTPLN